MNLRPYQRDTVDLIREEFKFGNRRVAAILPTGGGKTIVFSYLASKCKDDLLILTDRKELLTQAKSTLSKFGINSSVLNSKTRIDKSVRNKCTVAMVETWLRRIKKNPHLLGYKFVIIDECHKGVFAKVVKQLPVDTWVLGVTATPLSSNKKNPLNETFNSVVCEVDIIDLVNDGFLNHAITYSAKIDRSDLKKQGGEFTDESQFKTFAKREVYEGLIGKYNKYCQGRKTICFNVNIEHSKEVTRQFNEAGILSMHLDGSTPDIERESILSDFKTGKFLVLNNVGIVTTGYDEPSVSAIIINRATSSMPLYLQMAGRGSRLYEGKENFIILDMGENYKHLGGTWDTPRDWKQIFYDPKRANAGVAPVKLCPNCEAIIRTSLMTCPYCFHVFTPKEHEQAVLDVEFDVVKTKIEKVVIPKMDKPPIQMWDSLPIDHICQLVQTKTYQPLWAARLIYKRGGRDELKEFANKIGYKNSWVNWAINTI